MKKLILTISFFALLILSSWNTKAIQEDYRIEAPVAQVSDLVVPKHASQVILFRFQIVNEKPSEVNIEALKIRNHAVTKLQFLEKPRLLRNGNDFILGKYDPREGNELVFSDLKIPPLELVVFELMADLNAEIQQFYQFQLGNLTGGLINVIPSEEIGAIVIKNPNSKLSIPFMNAKKQIVSQFSLKAGKNKVAVKGIKLQFVGTLKNDQLKNLSLSDGNKLVSIHAAVLGALREPFAFPFLSPIILKPQEEKKLTLRADIANAQKSDHLRFILEKDDDLYAIDLTFGFGAKVINEFDSDRAFCTGSDSKNCPPEGLRKKCSRQDKKEKVRDCI